MLPHRHRVRHVGKETSDTFTLELTPTEGTRAWSFAAGQFNMLYVFGVGEIPVSISGDPGKPGTFVHTTRAVGMVSNAMRKLRRGDVVGVRGPFGRGWPVGDAKGSDVVLVAGGIGLAPLRPALYQLLANRESYGKIVLLYGTRTPADILYRKELERWRARLDVDVQVTVDRATGRWLGNVGVVPSLIAKASFDRLNTVAMICGPEIMMRYTALALGKRGVPAEHIHISMERNMKCAVGFCGHCQFGGHVICKDGPVFSYDQMKGLLTTREI